MDKIEGLAKFIKVNLKAIEGRERGDANLIWAEEHEDDCPIVWDKGGIEEFYIHIAKDIIKFLDKGQIANKLN